MSNTYGQVRQKVDRQLKQRQAKGEAKRNHTFDLSSSFYDDIESMKESYQPEKQSNYRCLQTDELQQQLRKERENLHQYQLNIDKLRMRMLQITKEESNIRESISEKRKYYNQLKVNLEKQHKNEIEKQQKGYEFKKENILHQIQALIGEKGKLLNEVEKMSEQIKKADNRNKRAQQNYNKQMKSRKQAFISLERQKSAKYESIRVQQLKQKAIKDTEPKLLAIIKSSNDDRKKAEEDQRKKLEQFKIQYKIKLEKDLTESKKRLFQQTEQEKEQLRIDIDKKNKEKYEEKQRQLDAQYSSLKEQYNNRIKEEEKRIRSQMQEFIMRNKDSYNSNIEQIKQLKVNYEAKLKKMNENLAQLKEKKLVEYEQKHRKNCEDQIKEINTTSQEKYKNAEEKIRKDITDKINKIKTEIGKEKNVFVDEINKKYEKNLLQEKNKMNETVAKEKKALQELQAKIIDIQKQKSKEEGKTQQLQKERNSLMTKNEDLQRKINTHQAQIQAYERYKFQKEKQIKKKCDDFGLQLQNKFQRLKGIYLKKQDDKQIHLKQLLDEFELQNKAAQDELHEFHQQIEQKIKSKKDQLKKILQQNSKLQRENQMLQRQIDQQSKKMRK